MNLKEQEKSLMNRLNELGLVRHIEHKTWTKKSVKYKYDHKIDKHIRIEVEVPDPQQIKSDFDYLPDVFIIAETTVELYEAPHWNNIMEDRREGNTTDFPRDVLSPVGIGISKCSDKDQFNRRIGRVIATHRAILSYEAMKNDCPEIKK